MSCTFTYQESISQSDRNVYKVDAQCLIYKHFSMICYNFQGNHSSNALSYLQYHTNFCHLMSAILFLNHSKCNETNNSCNKMHQGNLSHEINLLENWQK